MHVESRLHAVGEEGLHNGFVAHEVPSQGRESEGVRSDYTTESVGDREGRQEHSSLGAHSGIGVSLVSRPECISEATLIFMGETRSVVDFLE